MYRSNKKREKPPLDADKLRALALHYVGRYATTKSKLSSYLLRKIRERGWASEQPADVEALVGQFADLQYVNDEAFAGARARSFVARGFGKRRLDQDLYAAGIEEPDARDAHAHMEESAFEAAQNFARRKRIGPFASEQAPLEKQQKQLAAFMRAGHGFDIAKRFVHAAPGEIPEEN